MDLVGECEKARRQIVRVLLLANVENKFLEMRELVQPWRRSRRTFSPQKPPMESAAGDSDATASALGRYGSWHEKGHGKGKNRENGKGKGKGMMIGLGPLQRNNQ